MNSLLEAPDSDRIRAQNFWFQPHPVEVRDGPAPVYWANDLFLRRAISLAADMAESGRTPAPRTCRHGHSRAPLSAARRTSRPSWSSTARNSISVKLRRHRRARRYTLRIHPSDREAILTMPPRGTLAEAKDFAQRHGGWIAARLGRLPKAAPFQPGTVVPLRGVAAPDRASRRRARHGMDGDARQRREDPLRRRRCRASSTAACTISSSAKRARTCTRPRRPMPRRSASGSSGCRSATSRAAGAPAPRRARCRSPGG